MKNDRDVRKILVTGGCGYIGSHVTRQLSEAGFKPVVVDDLSNGFPDFLLKDEILVKGNSGDRALIENVLREHDIDSVMHFAASVVVPESVAEPVRYYENNVVNSLRLIEACLSAGVQNFIFSSTGSIYGEQAPVPTCETDKPEPTNPYSRSKWITECMLRDISSSSNLRHVILRYFNVAGADPIGRMGQKSRNATHLIKVGTEVACGKRSSLKIFGNDFNTADGTGVRDYIHVEDLANAHLKALNYLEGGGKSDVFNCGYGRGFSVLQVIRAIERASGKPLPVQAAPRRPGDISTSVADNRKILRVLDWKPKFDNIDLIVAHALAWEASLN
jgi:UDP-glucose 4-epimerase